MPVIADTAYPRLPAQPGPAELKAFTPCAAEVAFARQRTSRPGPRLALLVLPKAFQHLGRVVRLADVPAAVLAHVATSAGLTGTISGLTCYDDTTYASASQRLCAAMPAWPATTAQHAAWPHRPASKRRAPATAADRDEQRKVVKYNHLVANLLVFHTVVGMIRALDSLAADGHSAAITPKALAGTSPYLNEHLNRFGRYELDLSKPSAPLPFELPAYARPPSPKPASKAPV